MFTSVLGKSLLAASAVAGVALLAQPSPGQAATSDECKAYAYDVAADSNPRYRSFIGGLVSLPFDTTSALLTGSPTGGFAWKRVWDRAYSDCMTGRTAAVVNEDADVAGFTVMRPARGSDEWIEYCSAKYRSFDPDTGMYVTYSGEMKPCR